MKALIIEDDPSVAKIVMINLRNERFDCDHALDGAAGLRMAVANNYDVIILDLMLPNRSGDEICKQLRNANFNTVIIALTALSDLNTKIKMFNLGVDDYMVKPFEFQELFARIRSSLKKQKIDLGNILTYDDIKLDLKKHEVERRGSKIELREKEIKILEYLMRHPEQVLTREMILNYVWGPSVERFTNVVDVHVHNLRDKIDKPFGTKILRTVNNVGYKLKS